MSQDPAVIALGAVALSTSATVASLIIHLRHLGILDEATERNIYEEALTLLEEGQGKDKSGVFQAARELIERELRPSSGLENRDP